MKLEKGEEREMIWFPLHIPKHSFPTPMVVLPTKDKTYWKGMSMEFFHVWRERNRRQLKGLSTGEQEIVGLRVSWINKKTYPKK